MTKKVICRLSGSFERTMKWLGFVARFKRSLKRKNLFLAITGPPQHEPNRTEVHRPRRARRSSAKWSWRRLGPQAAAANLDLQHFTKSWGLYWSLINCDPPHQVHRFRIIKEKLNTIAGGWWLEHAFYFPIQLGMSSSQLTFTQLSFSEGYVGCPHQPDSVSPHEKSRSNKTFPKYPKLGR